MPQIEADPSVFNGQRTKEVKVDLIATQRKQLIRTFHEYSQENNQELAEFKQQSMCLFEDWVNSIYRLKLKKNELQLQFEGNEISVHPFAIEMILRKVIIQVCKVHKFLIESQMQAMHQAGIGENYFKIDAQTPQIGYYDIVNDEQEQSESNRIRDEGNEGVANIRNMVMSQQYYEYCVWIIYHHYCSLSECNQEVEVLVEHLKGCMKSNPFPMDKNVEFKKFMFDQYGLTELIDFDPTRSALLNHVEDYNNPGHMMNIINDYKLVRQGQFNILTISNLIPLSMPNVFVQSDLSQTNPHNSSKDLYEHIGRFENTINSIFLTNKQNMRKYSTYVDDFRKAIKVLRERLEITLGTQKKKFPRSSLLSKDTENFADFFEDPMLLEQLADEDFEIGGFDPQKIRFDYGKFILNIDRPLSKQKGKSWEINSIFSNENLTKIQNQKIKVTESFEKTRKKSQMKGIIENTEIPLKNKLFLIHNESFSKKQSKIIQKNNKNQFVFKQSQISEPELKGLEKTELKKIQSETCHARGSNMNSFFDKNNKNGQKDQIIMQKLKDNLHRLIRDHSGMGSSCRNEFNISDKINEKQVSKGLTYFEEQNSELNLHEFLQQNEFIKDHDEYLIDEHFLQKFDKQSKKKKKKNKKKPKNVLIFNDEQKENENQTSATEGSKQAPSVFEFSFKQFGNQQYAIIKNLMQMHFNLENRQECFQISEECIHQMKKRQQQYLKAELNHNIRPISKPKGKTKKQKNT